MPFEQAVDLGPLPVGQYDVTARTFVTYPGPFADPWLFPDEFNGTGPVDTLEVRFTVVPEPSAWVLLGLAGVSWACWHLGGNQTYWTWNVLLSRLRPI